MLQSNLWLPGAVAIVPVYVRNLVLDIQMLES